MSRLLENIVNNSHNISFDFSKSIKENNNIQKNIDNSLPVDVSRGRWSTSIVGNIESLVKNYNFKNFNHMFYFLSEALKEFNDKKIIPRINIEENNVTIVLYTDDINTVTESDILMSQYLDEINQDIIHIQDL